MILDDIDIFVVYHYQTVNMEKAPCIQPLHQARCTCREFSFITSCDSPATVCTSHHVENTTTKQVRSASREFKSLSRIFMQL